MESFINKFHDAVLRHWDETAVADFEKDTYTYSEFASNVAKTKLLWEKAGIASGAHIVINARSSANWLRYFFAAVTGDKVAVILFNGFTAKDVSGLVNHSEGKLLYTEAATFSKMELSDTPGLRGVIDCNTGKLLFGDDAFRKAFEEADAEFASRYPNGYGKDEFKVADRPMDDLCAIMYTSGSTGNPKGVEITVRNISSNIDMIPFHFPYRDGDGYMSVLPFAHIFGLVYDGIAPLCLGMHLCVLNMIPSPSNLRRALPKVNPRLFFAVPLILTKMIDATIGDFIKNPTGQARLEDHEHNEDFCRALRIIFMSAFGSQCEMLVTGGAAIPFEFENLLINKLGVNFISGYGMTETTPSICIGHPGRYKIHSCGEPFRDVQVKIDSEDPQHIPGEVLVKGDVVTPGYYKNPEATARLFTPDGWLHTGDIATMDADRSVFIVGRNKNMLLSSNGQNIYPEEIEVILNQLPLVAESIIVERDSKLVALIVPKQDEIADQNLDSSAVDAVLKQDVKKLNSQLPAYSAVSAFEARWEPFAKTPKGTIKRFMYK